MKGLFCVLLDVQVLGLNTNSIEMFFDLISIKIRTRDLTVKGCGINQFINKRKLQRLLVSPKNFFSENPINIININININILWIWWCAVASPSLACASELRLMSNRLWGYLQIAPQDFLTIGMFRAALRNRKLCKLWYVLIAATMLCAQLNVFILGSLEGTTRSPAHQYTWRKLDLYDIWKSHASHVWANSVNILFRLWAFFFFRYGWP